MLENNIQKKIYQKIKELGFSDLSLIFYDLTSSYFEGWECPLAEFGLSRDHRKDKLQILLALCVTKEGFPIYWKVLPGGLHDSKTVKEIITTLKEDFNIKDVILVMDKGMLSERNLVNLEENKFSYIVTLGRHQIKSLDSFPERLLKKLGEDLEKENRDKSLVLEKYPYFTYFSDRAYYHELKQEGNRRYILCFNPEKFQEERKQREEKIVSITNYLKNKNKELLKAKYSKDKKLKELKIYSYLKKRGAENLFKIRLNTRRKKIKNRTITTYQIEFSLREDKKMGLEICDGIYCLLTNLSEDMSAEFLLSSYRQRRKVEIAFSYLKGFIEIKPFYHQKEERVKAHITVCILAYLLQVTIEYLLRKKGIEMTYQEFRQKTEDVDVVELEIKNIRKTEPKIEDIPKDIEYLLEVLEMKEIIQNKFPFCCTNGIGRKDMMI